MTVSKQLAASDPKIADFANRGVGRPPEHVCGQRMNRKSCEGILKWTRRKVTKPHPVEGNFVMVYRGRKCSKCSRLAWFETKERKGHVDRQPMISQASQDMAAGIAR